MSSRGSIAAITVLGEHEVARAIEERSSLEPVANQPREVFNIKSAAISSDKIPWE
jgi:hypothetical protein